MKRLVRAVIVASVMVLFTYLGYAIGEMDGEAKLANKLFDVCAPDGVAWYNEECTLWVERGTVSSFSKGAEVIVEYN